MRMIKCEWKNVDDNINLRCFLTLSCKIRPKEFINRNIIKKVKLKKYKKRKDFDQGTGVIQAPSFTTSRDYGYLLLSKNPLPKTSVFKISQTLPRSRTGYPLYPNRQVGWAHRAFAATHCTQHVWIGFSVTSSCNWTAQGPWSRPTATILSLNLSLFRKRELMDLISVVDQTSTLSLLLEIFANHFCVCLSSESAGSSSARQYNKTKTWKVRALYSFCFGTDFIPLK